MPSSTGNVAKVLFNRYCENCCVPLLPDDILVGTPECPRCALWHIVLRLPIVRHLTVAFGDDGLWVVEDHGPYGSRMRRRLQSGEAVRP